jgi:spore germination cell wall hydrolase CwlJ-like protein
MDRNIELIIICVIVTILTAISGEGAVMDVTPSEVVTATLILEAGGEYSTGAMEAVHEVIMKRSEQRGITPAEVCLQRSQFSCWDSKRVSQMLKAKRHKRWDEALKITRGQPTNYTGGADHYHADYCDPYWNKHMEMTVKIGRHIFYK